MNSTFVPGQVGRTRKVPDDGAREVGPPKKTSTITLVDFYSSTSSTFSASHTCDIVAPRCSCFLSCCARPGSRPQRREYCVVLCGAGVAEKLSERRHFTHCHPYLLLLVLVLLPLPLLPPPPLPRRRPPSPAAVARDHRGPDDHLRCPPGPIAAVACTKPPRVAPGLNLFRQCQARLWCRTKFNRRSRHLSSVVPASRFVQLLSIIARLPYLLIARIHQNVHCACLLARSPALYHYLTTTTTTRPPPSLHCDARSPAHSACTPLLDIVCAYPFRPSTLLQTSPRLRGKTQRPPLRLRPDIEQRA